MFFDEFLYHGVILPYITVEETVLQADVRLGLWAGCAPTLSLHSARLIMWATPLPQQARPDFARARRKRRVQTAPPSLTRTRPGADGAPQTLQATHFHLHIISVNVEMQARFLRHGGLEKHVKGWTLWGCQPGIG